MLLSKYGDAQQVTEMFEQDWVQGWQGWAELDATATDAEYMHAATRFERVAQKNRPAQLKSNAARLEELAAAGLTLIYASPHGVNNCLIDSVLLGLIRVGVLGLPNDMDMRRRVCADCRSYLMTEHNVGYATYLDAHWDVPRILDYFLRIAWPQTVAVRIHLYDRFEQEGLGTAVQGELNRIEYVTEPGAGPCHELHIFNHSSEDGVGYHFDLLWPSGEAMARSAMVAIPPVVDELQTLAHAGGEIKLVQHILATRLPLGSRETEGVNETRKLLRRALDEARTEPPTDATALQRWKDSGYVLDRSLEEEPGLALISALWKSLCAYGILPREQPAETVEARDMLHQCRAAVIGPNTQTPALNWWRDSGAVVQWLLDRVGAEAPPNIRLQCADRHHLEEIAPRVSTLHIIRSTSTVDEARTIRIYAQSTLTGQEWRYDALVPKPQESPPSAEGESPGKLEETVPKVGEVASTALPAAENNDASMSATDSVAGSNPRATGPTDSAAGNDPNVTGPCGTPVARQDVARDGAQGARPVERHAAESTDLKTCLQNFLHTRAQAPISVCEADVAALRAMWQNLAEVGALLQRLLGATVSAFEPTRKNAHVLAKAWMRYYIACAQGHGRKLGTARTQEAKATHEAIPTNTHRPKTNTHRPNTADTTRAEHPPVTEHPTVETAGDVRPRSPPKKRYRKKAPQEESKPSDMEQQVDLEEDEYWLGTWKREHGNQDPRAEKDAALQELANLLRPQPLWPTGFHAADPALDLPTWRCAFRECTFESETFDALPEHILCKHGKELRKVTDLKQPPLAWEDAGMEAHRAALTVACQANPPTAHAATDRRCLRQFQAAKDKDAVGAAICFACARRFPHMETGARRLQDVIVWRRVLGPGNDECLGAIRPQVEKWFGYEKYWERYGRQHGHEAQALLEEQLQDWESTLYYEAAAPLRIICCPEDKVCARRCAASVTCPKCRAPVCDFCWTAVNQKKPCRQQLWQTTC